MDTPSTWVAGADSRQNILWVMLLVMVTAAILFAASQLLPTAVTVSIDPATKTEPAVNATETGAPDPVQTAKAINAEKAPDPVEIAGIEVPQSRAPKESTTSAADISAAKTAPVVAVVPAAVKPSPPKPPVSVRSGRYLLQLASLPTAREAKREVSRLQNRLRGVLGKRKIAVVRAVPKGKGPVYRLRASAYQTRNSARAACDRVKKLRVGCLVVRR